MRRPGILGTISLLSGLVLAVPMGVIGFEFLRQGRSLLGAAFLGLAVALVWLPEYVQHRLSWPWTGLRSRLIGGDSRDGEPDEESSLSQR